ncbi:MAG: DUF1828 domain-containing protein, partial [Alphaproteobacteria bacterium]|nr:DUF1828 domain-containing protein [Alphaproteobacteria bacterium]
LVISVPNPKTLRVGGHIDSTSTEIAAEVYRNRLLMRNDGANDYLFLNEIKDRNYAGDSVSQIRNIGPSGRRSPMNKEMICEAFCREIDVRKVPSGLAVTTPFGNVNGDSIGFYVVREPNSDRMRIEDDGTNVSFLEGLGVNLRSGLRKDIFDSLLDEYGLIYDNDSGEIRSSSLDESEVPAMAIRFVAMLLRLQDLGLLHPTTVESTFREDANAAIEARFLDNDFAIKHDEAINSELKNYQIDSILEPPDRLPMAVYYGTSENRVNEAVLLWMETHHVLHANHQVLLLLETASPRHISERSLARAFNYLDAVAVFRGEEKTALDKIASYVERSDVVHH